MEESKPGHCFRIAVSLGQSAGQIRTWAASMSNRARPIQPEERASPPEHMDMCQSSHSDAFGCKVHRSHTFSRASLWNQMQRSNSTTLGGQMQFTFGRADYSGASSRKPTQVVETCSSLSLTEGSPSRVNSVV